MPWERTDYVQWCHRNSGVSDSVVLGSGESEVRGM